MHKENENHKKGRNILNIAIVTVLCLILVIKGLVLNHFIKFLFILLWKYICVIMIYIP